MNWQDFRFIISQSSANKSLFRAFQNLEFKKRVSISKKVIDLGAKDGKYEYHNLASKTPDTHITFTDLHPKRPEVLKIDFDHKFPLDSNIFDYVLLFNVLEHVWDTRNLLSESLRILNPGGKIYGLVPFLFRYHKDPSDYWRFTDESLRKLLHEAGFDEIKIYSHGIGCFTVSVNTFSNLFRFKIIIAFAWSIAIFLDMMLSKVWPQNQTYYLGLFFTASKSKL
tara:strand:+ start:150 stop:821 length:672 start_codon:yes stop_codon:yes gene_type:complete